MSETTNLKLYKHDNPETNTDKFDVDKTLNENWDKIDEEIGQERVKIAELEEENTDLKAENERLKQDLNALPSGQAEGENIDLTDSAEMRFSNFKIRGNSRQETREGYNLLELINGTYENNGITAVVKDGIITLNGTATGTSFVHIPLIAGSQTLLANTQYTLRAFNEKTVGDSANISALRMGDNGTYQAPLYNTNSKYIHGQASDYIFNAICIRTESGLTYNNFVVKPQLELGNGTDTWEQGGKSPTTDYPSEVESCGDILNLFDGELESGNINSSGVNYADSTMVRSKNYTKVKPNTDIIIANNETIIQANVIEYDENYSFIAKTYVNATKITTNSKTNYIKFVCSPVTENKIKIEHNSKPTPYSPYGQGCINEVVENEDKTQSQTFSIPTQQPMRAIGDIRDTFVKVNNKWYERHNVKRIILDGSEGWSVNSGVGFHTPKLQGIIKNSSEALSNKYKYTTLSWQGNYTFSVNSTGLIAISDNTYSTVDDFKDWLQSQYNTGTPVYVDYLLATPIDIECTEEQVAILDEIENTVKSYKGVTHIYSTDEVGANVEVTYKKDIETLFANTLV